MLRTKVDSKEGHVEIAISGNAKEIVADLALITLHVKEQLKDHGDEKAEALLVMTLSGILLDIDAEDMIEALTNSMKKDAKKKEGDKPEE